VTETGPDLVVAGAGGGLVAALRGAELGLDVLVVEVSVHVDGHDSRGRFALAGCRRAH